MAQINWKEVYSKLGKRTEGYALAVRGMFQQRIGEIIAMCEGLELEEGKPFAFADYEVAPAVQKKLRQLYAEVYKEIRGSVVREWNYANANSDKLIKGLFGSESIENNHYAKYFQRNKQAMQAFLTRQTNGLDLSQRVWQYVGQTRTDLEAALDLGLGQGLSADTLSRQVREYLNNPDDLFRRFRYKKGEDADGNPIYGRKWKRRCYDKDTDSFYWVDANPKDYHTGTGVYRSSYKNAMRLTRTETNMAYRSADIARWQQMDFVVGYEVKMSKNHPCHDICDDLQGRYPKEFQFVGWHPHCYCYIVPIMCSDQELEQLTDQILRGEDTEGFTPAGVVSEMPANFTEWISKNADRIQEAQSLPYFIRDNYTNGDITKGLRWETEYKNEAGLANFSKLMGKAEIDIDEFTHMQTVTAKEFSECSNFVEAGTAGGFPLSTATTSNGWQFEELGKLSDPTELANLLAEAGKGNNLLAQYCTPEQLAELERIATQAKFAAKADGKFMVALDKDTLKAVINGDTATFSASRYVGTNYSKLCSAALENGVVGANEGAVCVLDLPKGSRYLQTMAKGEPTAMLLPNSKFKVVSTEVKTVVRAGKSTEVLHYHLELVDDGSSFVKEVAESKAKVKAEVAAHNKAVKVANNVLGAASKGHYELLGIDTTELESVLANGTTAEVKAATKELAKEMAAAKKLALQEAVEQPNMWALAQEFGVADAKAFMANWQAQLDRYKYYLNNPDPKYSAEQKFMHNVIEKGLTSAKANPTKYSTTGKFIEYMEKLKLQFEAKLELATIQADIDSVVAFAAQCKSTAKIHGMVDELLYATSSKQLDMPAIKAQLAKATKEMERLEAERLKLLKKKGVNIYDIEQFYSQTDKKQLDKLRAELESAVRNANGDIRDYSVVSARHNLVDFTLDMSRKYASVQPSLAHIGGITEAEITKAMQEYLATTPTNPYVWVREDLSKLTTTQASELKRIQQAIEDAWSKCQTASNKIKYEMELANARNELNALCNQIAASPQRGALNCDAYNHYYRVAFGCDVGGAFTGKKFACELLSKELAGYGLNVTWEELSLITRYCQGSNFVNNFCFGYGAVQRCIDPVVKRELTSIIEKYIKAVNGVMERMPRYNGVTYRGVDILPSAIKNPSKDGFWDSIIKAWNSPNKIWETPNPTSSSYRLHVADSFAEGTMNVTRKGQRVIMKIAGRTGVEITKISPFSTEAEILFRAGSKFRMLKAPYQCTKAGIGRIGDWVVELEEVL